MVGKGERLLVIAPHPDDETLGAGGLIQRVRARGGTARIVLITAGDGYGEAVAHETGRPQPRPAQFVAYGERRLRESRSAVRTLAGDHVRLQILGFPDGGVEGLLRAHWWRSHPARSTTTNATDPPYDEALEPDVPYDGADLRREIANILREEKPTLIALPDPLDQHPDHRAAGLFTLLAINDWMRDRSKRAPVAPKLLAYLVHWSDWPPTWDAPAPVIDTDAALDLPPTLPPRELDRITVELTDEEIATKRAALAKYTSQQEAMPVFLAAFVRRTEPFTILTAAELRNVEYMIEPAAQQPLTPSPEP